MKEIIFLRHAKADNPADCRDFDRPLANKGRRDAERIGAAFFSSGINPDLVVCSNALRTRETYSLIAPFFTKTPELIYTDELYVSDVAAYKQFIAEAEDRFQSILFVGHNPSVGIMTLILDELSKGHMMGTANAVQMVFETNQWSEVRYGKIKRIILPD